MHPVSSHDSENGQPGFSSQIPVKKSRAKLAIVFTVVGIVLFIAGGWLFSAYKQREEQRNKEQREQEEEGLRMKFPTVCRQVGTSPSITTKARCNGPFWIEKTTPNDLNLTTVFDYYGIDSHRGDLTDHSTFKFSLDKTGHASSRRETKTLACAVIDCKVLEGCSYGGSTHAERLSCNATITLIDIETGQAIESINYEAQSPQCPNMISRGFDLKRLLVPDFDEKILHWVQQSCK